MLQHLRRIAEANTGETLASLEKQTVTTLSILRLSLEVVDLPENISREINLEDTLLTISSCKFVFIT
jgi:hypothetical protein